MDMLFIEQQNRFMEDSNRMHQEHIRQNNMLMQYRRAGSGKSHTTVKRHLVSRDTAYKFLVLMMKNRMPEDILKRYKVMGLYGDYVDCREWCSVCTDSLNQQIEFVSDFMDKTIRYMRSH